MSFLGDHRTPRIVGEAALPGVHNYFLDDDRGRWRTGVPIYRSVLYESMYPGIDLRLRESKSVPEYDLLLDPGADLSRLIVQVEGGRGLSIAPDGSLVIDTALGPVMQSVPETWETFADGHERDVICNFVLLGWNRFGFAAPDWAGETSLTIDPGLQWSTYLGASSDDYCEAVFVHGNGVVTVAGCTASLEFPTTTGAYQPLHGGGCTAVLSRLDSSRTGPAQLVYSTFLGRGRALGLSVDTGGVVTVVGRTSSSQFPTTSGAYQTTYGGGSDDAFVSCLDPGRTGAAQLLYSTLLGGSGREVASELDIDSRGVVTVAGYTLSADFPTTSGSYSPTYNRGQEVFVSRLDPGRTGTAQLLYSSYLGGGWADFTDGIAVDGGVVTVVGLTFSRDFPTTRGAYDTTYNGYYDCFISRLDPGRTGTAQLLYSTFLGGGIRDGPGGLAVDSGGVVTVAGHTFSSDFPTTSGAYESTFRGSATVSQAFVSRLDPARVGVAQLVYSTFLGGSDGANGARALAVDTTGVVTLAGFTLASAFPTTAGACDTTHNGGHDVFVSRLDPTRVGAAQLVYSTFLGGIDNDNQRALAVGLNGSITVVGDTWSRDYPTTGAAYAPTFGGGVSDGFVTRLDMLPTGVSVRGASSPGCSGPLAMSVSSWPQAGNAAFSLTCNNAPPSTVGAALLGAASLSTPVTVLGVDLWVNPAGPWFLVLPTISNQVGAGDFALALPARSQGSSFHGQFVWAGPASPAPCPPRGFSASHALDIAIQR